MPPFGSVKFVFESTPYTLRPFILAIFLFATIASGRCATNEVDSLRRLIRNSENDSLKGAYTTMLCKRLYRNKPDSCVIWLNEALALFQRDGHEIEQASCFQVLGVIEKNRANYEQALAHQLKAMSIFEAHEAFGFLATVCNDVGIIYKSMESYEKANEYYKRAYELAVKTENTNGQAMLLNNIGTIFDAQDQLDSALLYYSKAYALSVTHDLLQAQAVSLSNLGEIHARRNQFDKAASYFSKALAVDNRTEDAYGQIYSHTNLGNALTDLGIHKRARAHLDSALVLSKSLKAKHLERRIYEVLSRSFELEGNYASALANYKLFRVLNDSIYDENKLEQFQELEVKYETEKKEREIAQLSEEQVASDLAISNQKNLILSLVSGLILVLGGGAFFIYQRRKRAEALLVDQELSFRKNLLDSTVIAEEKERQRIAKDLHDGLVQSLAALKLGVQNVLNKAGIEGEKRMLFQDHLDQIDQAANEARSISHQMMPRALMESGLVIAMDDMLHKTLGQSAMEYNFEHFGIGEERFKQSIEIGLYRIAQELVNNILKHSKAKSCVIQIYKTKTHLILHVEDDGEGFKFQEKEKQSGIGLSNIFSRASSVNGEVNYEGGQPHETIANVRVPLD